MKLYLVRHAQPKVAEYAGFPGPSLGKEGNMQAQKIANYLKTKNINTILTSDYIRVLETLQPYKNISKIPIELVDALRERENNTETHDELVERVQNWFKLFLFNYCENTAIFSHCGPINMILFWLDPQRNILEYPFECEYLCLTPKAGIWELDIENQVLIQGKLIMECC